MLKQSQFQFKPIAGGVSHFLDELIAGNPEGEGIIETPNKLVTIRLTIDTPKAQESR